MIKTERKNKPKNDKYRQITQEIINEYIRCKFKINHFTSVKTTTSIYSNTEIQNTDKESSEQFVTLVEHALKMVGKENYQVLDQAFMNKKDLNTIAYSASWWYRKVELACKKFCEFLLW